MQWYETAKLGTKIKVSPTASRYANRVGFLEMVIDKDEEKFLIVMEEDNNHSTTMFFVVAAKDCNLF